MGVRSVRDGFAQSLPWQKSVSARRFFRGVSGERSRTRSSIHRVSSFRFVSPERASMSTQKASSPLWYIRVTVSNAVSPSIPRRLSVPSKCNSSVFNWVRPLINCRSPGAIWLFPVPTKRSVCNSINSEIGEKSWYAPSPLINR